MCAPDPGSVTSPVKRLDKARFPHVASVALLWYNQPQAGAVVLATGYPYRFRSGPMHERR